MPELTRKPDFIPESLAMKRVLEGLVHNMNTPLNLILGYAQQLKKQHPEFNHAETILSAGLKIDDMLRSCMSQLDLRDQEGERDIVLNDWLPDEIKLLRNVLEIKRNINLEVKIPTEELHITIQSLLLSIVVECIVIRAVRQKPVGSEDYALILELSSESGLAIIKIVLPVETETLGLEPDALWQQVNGCFEVDAEGFIPLQITMGDRMSIILKYPLKAV